LYHSTLGLRAIKKKKNSGPGALTAVDRCGTEAQSFFFFFFTLVTGP